MATYFGSLVQLCCGEGGRLQTNTAGMCGQCSHWMDHPGFAQPKAGCTFRVHSAQAPGCPVRVLSQVDPVFCALPKSKPLRFLGAPQGHRPRWAVCLVLIPGPSCSGDQCLASPLSQVGHASYPPPYTVSCVCHEGLVPGVPCVSSGKLISVCDTAGGCGPSRIPGRCG